MKLKAKYQINNDTWSKLIKNYLILLVLGVPFVTLAFWFFTWAILDDMSWSVVTVVPGMITYAAILSIYKMFFTRSKYTVLLIALFLSLFGYFFAILSNASVFRLFGNSGLIINTIFILIATSFFSRRYFKYWDKVWNSHSSQNESKILDKENARYDYLNNFNMDESNIEKKVKRKYSNPALISLVSFIAPICVGAGLILSKFGMEKIVFIICWVLSLPVIFFGFTKVIMAGFYNYRKLSYFEKKLGKPIINGLLE